MCIAIPAEVKEVSTPWANVDLQGTLFQVNMLLTPEIKVGDYVLVHAGFSIEVLSLEDAKETLEIWEEVNAQIKDE